MQQMDPITIMIVDDHPGVRDALRLFVESTPDLKLIAEARSGEEALELCANSTPNVILMDVMMPGMGGLAAIKILHEKYPNVPVIALTNHLTQDNGQTIIQAGASSFLYKNLAPKDLEYAIRAVYKL